MAPGLAGFVSWPGSVEEPPMSNKSWIACLLALLVARMCGIHYFATDGKRTDRRWPSVPDRGVSVRNQSIRRNIESEYLSARISLDFRHRHQRPARPDCT